MEPAESFVPNGTSTFVVTNAESQDRGFAISGAGASGVLREEPDPERRIAPGETVEIETWLTPGDWRPGEEGYAVDPYTEAAARVQIGLPEE